MKCDLEKISSILFEYEQFNIGKYEISFLKNAVVKRIRATNCTTDSEYCTLLTINSFERKIFIGTLHNSYSEFFRNSLSYSVIEQIIVPSFVRKSKEIRVWSAACALGQEAYSLAMIFEDFNKVKRDFKYRIFATDKDPLMVNTAQNGLFDLNLLSNVSLKRFNAWFVKSNEGFKIKQELKAHIDFSVFDLLNSSLSYPSVSIYGDFDLVFCANLLFYYKNEFRISILEKITKSLSKGGFLITGEAEREIISSVDFKEIYPHSAIFIKK